MKSFSLRLRLIIALLIVSVGTWLAAAVSAWIESREYTDEFFDTYQLLLARQLSTAVWDNINQTCQHQTDKIFDKLENDGEEDDEALGFAVFNKNGNLIFHDDENGQYFIFQPDANGFVNQEITSKKKKWRIVFVKSTDNQFTIAVGQELKYRHAAAFELMLVSLIPWFFGLILLIIACAVSVTYELKPLRVIAGTLSKRSPKDLSPITLKQVPTEINPLITSMNALFARIQKMVDRERSFIADSAHELRSPITALKVQLEVAELSVDDPVALKQSLLNLKEGVERSSRLIEQLLTLSKVDSQTRETDNNQTIDWKHLVNSTLDLYTDNILDKSISIKKNMDGTPPVKQGDLLLWQILMRNIIDNAVKYCAEKSTIHIILADRCFIVQNAASTVPDNQVKHLGERFFRPAGQLQSGSGLGLSIVKKIALLHQCKTEIDLQDEVFQISIHK